MAHPSSATRCAPPPRRRLPVGRRVLDILRLAADGLETLAVWQERARQRRTLRALDDRLLADVGLSRADAEAEGRKPFWRA